MKILRFFPIRVQGFAAIGCMAMRVILSFILLVSGALRPAVAQEVTLHFPRFAGKAWDVVIPRGERQDTVLSGSIAPDGRSILRIPEAYRHHRGICRWMLRDGGGLDMVVNGEDFAVECLSGEPDEDNIKYKGSAENAFLVGNHGAQEALLKKYAAVTLLAEAYGSGHPLHAAALEEKARLESVWKTFRSDVAASPLYAARFREIVDLTRGITDGLGQGERQKAEEMDDFISRRMSWEALYTSNHWNAVIYQWVRMHSEAIRSDGELLGSARRILTRITAPEIYTSFCEVMARYFVREGKDSLLGVLSPEVRASGRLSRFDGMLAQFGAPRTGDLAPDLYLSSHPGNRQEEAGPAVRYRSAELSMSRSLLVFYQSGCGPCEQTMGRLVALHPFFQKEGIRLISLSADTDRKLFQDAARGYPWSDKYCDERGFRGPNFERYGVAGTPTLFLLDSGGRIVLRTEDLSEVLERVARAGS